MDTIHNRTTTRAAAIFGGWSNAPITTQADSFELARMESCKELLLLSDAQCIKYVSALDEETDFNPADRQEAYSRLHRAFSPLALQAAVNATRKVSAPGFDACLSSAHIALWLVVKRWNPAKGMKLSRFINLMLPVELDRQIKDEELISRTEWKRIAVSTVIEMLLSQGANQPYLTWYADTQLEVIGKRLMAFPTFTSVTSTTTRHGQLMTLRTPDTTSSESVVNGKRKVIQTPVANPMLSWQNSKAALPKAFLNRRLNTPRKTKRSTTGFKVSELMSARSELHRQLRAHPLLTSSLMKSRLFARPARPLRRDDITPRMVQDAMRQHRRDTGAAFDEKAWSTHAIATLMDELYREVSLDAPVLADGEHTASLADFLAAPEQDDDEIPEMEFSFDELADASDIVVSLQTSGLWEIALSIPLHKFLKAFRISRAAFCTLASSYGIRVRHAILICQTIEARLH